MDILSFYLVFSGASAAFSLPQGLLPALCYVESSHRPNVVHHDDGNGDSLGLCQIKLSTSRMMGFKGTQKQLMDPYVNAYYAAKYLRHQIGRYRGDVVKALVAYNMGSAKSFTHSKYSDKVIKQWRNNK